MKTIALEEHFISPLCRESLPPHVGRKSDYDDLRMRLGYDAAEQLADLGEKRIQAMDAAGIDVQVLSLTLPGAQRGTAEASLAVAMDANDRIFEAIKRYPTRFSGFAAIPTVDPGAAAKELDRAVTRLGFKGALINGHTEGCFLDDKKYWTIFECAESLDVPIYLHPNRLHRTVHDYYFSGYEEMARAAWGYALDTSTHFLRILLSGVFDAYPRLKIILGHLGEGIPFGMHRFAEHTRLGAARKGLRKTPEEYLRDHLIVTTSGSLFVPAFLCTVMALGIDNVLFSVDWPYEANTQAMEFLKSLPISEIDREKVAHLNAERVLRL